MPVILNPEQWSVWLSQKEQSPDKLLPVINLKEYKSMQAWLVTRELNRAGFRNDEGLVEPLPDTK